MTMLSLFVASVYIFGVKGLFKLLTSYVVSGRKLDLLDFSLRYFLKLSDKNWGKYENIHRIPIINKMDFFVTQKN